MRLAKGKPVVVSVSVRFPVAGPAPVPLAEIEWPLTVVLPEFTVCVFITTGIVVVVPLPVSVTRPVLSVNVAT
jgi:hypothetical protein